MFYVKTKTQVSDNVEIKVDLYDDQIFTACNQCNKEIEVDTQTLINVLYYGDLASTSLTCTSCTKKQLEDR